MIFVNVCVCVSISHRSLFPHKIARFSLLFELMAINQFDAIYALFVFSQLAHFLTIIVPPIRPRIGKDFICEAL